MNSSINFELYRLIRSEKIESIKLHRETLQHYLAFTVTVLGATIAGVFQLKASGWIGKVILAGPILNGFICLLAIKMCNRFYLGFLERVAITAKLESGLELTAQRTDPKIVFPEDNYILPNRWMPDEKFKTANEFIDEHKNSGINNLSKLTFYTMIVVNVVLAIIIIFASFV